MTQLVTNQTFTPDQLKLITSTIAKDASPDELKLFLYRAQSLGLDPLKPGQIYFIKYNKNSPGTIVIGIDGFRSKANRTGKLSGIKRGALRDDKGKCIGAWAEVYRTDWTECAREEVPMAEYNTGHGNWSKMPETMIKKVAEVAALRMAFPDDLGGLYSDDEMEQAAKRPPPVHTEPPGENDGSTEPSGFRFTFGQYTGRSLEQVYNSNDAKGGPKGMANYVAWLDKQEKIKPLSAGAMEARKAIEDFLGAMENKPLEKVTSRGGTVQPEPLLSGKREPDFFDSMDDVP